MVVIRTFNQKRIHLANNGCLASTDTQMKKATKPTFRTPELLKWTFVGLVLLPIGMMAHNAYVFLEGENVVLVDENTELIEEVTQLKEDNVELGVT
ncbi:MAG: hypothetical protein ACI9MB_004391, partial [Verrucomicrobiales bacterium]